MGNFSNNLLSTSKTGNKELLGHLECLVFPHTGSVYKCECFPQCECTKQTLILRCVPFGVYFYHEVLFFLSTDERLEF